MPTKNVYSFSSIGLLLLLLGACLQVSSPDSPASDLYAKFQYLPAADTIHIALDTIVEGAGTTIAAASFLAALDSALLASMIYEPDTFDFRAQALWKTTLDEEYDACLLNLRQAWFQFKYLLIYSKFSESFVDLLPVAYLFGGEGGQILMESWMFDFNTRPAIISSQLERSMHWSETHPEEPILQENNTVGQWQWSNGEFMEYPVRDTAAYLQRFPLVWD